MDLSFHFQQFSFSQPTGCPKEDHGSTSLSFIIQFSEHLWKVTITSSPWNYIKNWNRSDFPICIPSTALYEVRGAKSQGERISFPLSWK